MKQKLLHLLKPYGSVLSTPQFNHFSHFIHSLSVCEIPSISRFSELHDKDRSCLNRFLTESPWLVSDVKSVYHKELNNYLAKESCILIDDTLSHRPYAKKVELANWHFDHTLNKQSLGYCVVTSTIKSKDNIIPYDLLPYYRKSDCTTISYKSKNELAKEIIESTRNNSKVKYAIFDSWYSNEIVIGACKEANKKYITQIKSNRNVTINYKKRAVRAHANHIEEREWETFTFDNNIFRIFSTSAFISKVGSVHLIFSQFYDEDKEKWGETNYIISNMIDVQSYEVIVMYLNRVGIESFHREAKQNTGLEGYFLRNNRGIERYLFLVMLAYATLVLQSIEMKEIISIGKMCEERKVEVYMQAYEEIERNPAVKEAICRRLARARI